MLVISRYTDESIVIGDDIVVMVLGVESDGRVKLGIEAPRRVPVFRKELVDQSTEHKTRNSQKTNHNS